jgi:hypothetical protein
VSEKKSVADYRGEKVDAALREKDADQKIFQPPVGKDEKHCRSTELYSHHHLQTTAAILIIAVHQS